MTKERIIQMLETLDADEDAEAEHGDADYLVTMFLRENGYPDVATAYEEALARIGEW